MYLTQGLHRSMQRHPEKIATSALGHTQTFRQLTERVARLAGALRTLGVRKGDRVAMLALNSDRYIEFLLASWWLGAVATPVNTRWSDAEIRYSLNDCGSLVLIVDDEHLSRVPAILAGAATVRATLYTGTQAPPRGLLSFEGLLVTATPIEDARCAGDDLAAILYTGGTTGFPKGVMLSHANLWSAAMGRMAEVPNPERFTTLLTAPLFHVAGLGRVIGQTLVGGTCVTLPQFRAEALLQTIERERITDLVLVPSMIQMMLDDPSFGRYRLDSLERILWGAAPITVPLLERALDAFPGVEFIHVYGMTETAAAVSVNGQCNDPEARRSGRVRSAGRAGYAAEVRIVDNEGREVPRGTVGEIAVRGPMVMMGYWNKPEETAKVLRDGWLYTGDGAYMNEEGWLFVVDRIKDMIITGGENVYPAEVETVLGRHPAVAAAAVIGIPSEQWGESVHAVVVLRDGAQASADELRTFCRGLLGGYKCPKSIEFRTTLPTSAAGKVVKSELRKEYWEPR
ncbi:MAG TPA: long-chain fatty acid--CoA ligase [Burkholderiaceae bacterium]|nr:long-chain fatty acid--CoA ligase [Burkholderiaceae bacterium]